MIRGIIEKEFIYIFRDKRTIILNIFSPIVFICLANYFMIYILQGTTAFEEGIYIAEMIVCMMLTMILFLSILTGALEIGVGEKERGTLCSTLRTGIGFRILFLGKYLVTVLQGLISLIILDVLMFLLSLIPNSFFGILFSYRRLIYKGITINIILLVCILCFSALELMISYFVHNFKEGQLMSIPFMFAVLIPFYIVLNSGGHFMSKVGYFVPFINTALMLSDIISEKLSVFNLIKYLIINSIIILSAVKVIFVIMSKESSLVRR